MQFGNPLTSVSIAAAQFKAATGTGSAVVEIETIPYPAGTTSSNPYKSCYAAFQTANAPTAGSIVVYVTSDTGLILWHQTIPYTAIVAAGNVYTVPLPISFGNLTATAAINIVNNLTVVGNLSWELIFDQSTMTPGVLIGGIQDGLILPVSIQSLVGTLNTIDQNLKNAIAALGAAIPADAVQIGGTDGTDLRALLVGTALGETTPTGKLAVLPDPLPVGATPFCINSNAADAALTLTAAAVAGKINYITGLDITSLGSTALTTVSASLSGLYGAQQAVWLYTSVAGVTTANTPLSVRFAPPLAGAVDTAVTFTLPALGAGNAHVQGNMYGYTL